MWHCSLNSASLYFKIMKDKNRKNLHHWNTPGHAHELTFSCYHSSEYFTDENACMIFTEELEKSKKVYSFKLLAYVIMPSHVHLLIWPEKKSYSISRILAGTKGIISKRYKLLLREKNSVRYNDFCVNKQGEKVFRFWQPGGGFDRNILNANAINNAINYIENNPVRAGLVSSSENWKWSSAYSRHRGTGLMPDECTSHVLL